MSPDSMPVQFGADDAQADTQRPADVCRVLWGRDEVPASITRAKALYENGRDRVTLERIAEAEVRLAAVRDEIQLAMVEETDLEAEIAGLRGQLR